MTSRVRRLLSILAVIPVVSQGQTGSTLPIPAPLQRFEADAPDSLALERTRCLFGGCPAYRVSLDRYGRMHFVSGRTGAVAATHGDSLTPLAMLYLMHEAERARLAELPLPLDASPLCAHRVFDMPSAYVWIYRGTEVTKVADYQGCVPIDPVEQRTLEALRTFEQLIDAVTGSYRWAGAN